MFNRIVIGSVFSISTDLFELQVTRKQVKLDHLLLILQVRLFRQAIQVKTCMSLIYHTDIRKGYSPEGGQALKQNPQGSGHSHKLPKFKQHLAALSAFKPFKQGLNSGGSFVEPEVGLGDSCGLCTTQDILFLTMQISEKV